MDRLIGQVLCLGSRGCGGENEYNALGENGKA